MEPNSATPRIKPNAETSHYSLHASVQGVCCLRVIILSPHRDDAAFSCGLLMFHLAQRNTRLTVVNVCTGSDYAPYLSSDTLDRVKQVTAARLAEDLQFADAVTALSGTREAVEWVDLRWKDAPLRLDIATEDVLQGSVTALQGVSDLSEVFKDLPEADVVLAPLALGDHIDHRLVRQAALHTFGERVILYEDLPYACRMSSADRSSAISMLAPSGFQAWSPKTAATGMKRRFAMCYPSQIASNVADEMETYAAENGNAERFYGQENSLRRLEMAIVKRGGVAE